MLSNFLIDICGVAPNYTMNSRKEECINYIKEQVGQNKVLVSAPWIFLSFHSVNTSVFVIVQLLASGGVDSTVCAALLRVALDPKQIIVVHIDNGTLIFHIFPQSLS